MRLSKPRIDPLPESEWNAEIREAVEPARSGVGLGKVPNILATIARHPKLLKRWNVFGNHVLVKSTLPPREREILILRIGWLCRSEYEWAAHAPAGRRLGMTDADIQRIVDGSGAGGDPIETVLLRAVDELHRDSVVSDSTWRELAAVFDSKQLLDILITTGGYRMVSMALNSFGVQLEPGAERFPASLR